MESTISTSKINLSGGHIPSKISLSPNLASNPRQEIQESDSRIEEQALEHRIRAGILPLFLTSVTQGLFKIKQEDFPNLETQPFKMIPKADLLSDIQTRLAISDFYPAKQQILDFPLEEIVVHQDKDFKYGQNFFIAITTDAVDAILKPLVAESKLDNHEIVQKPVSRVWRCLGSDKELEAEDVVLGRDLIIVQASRKLKDFGAPCEFGDRDAHDAFLECRPYRDPNYEIFKSEVHVATQAVAETIEMDSQTTWFASTLMKKESPN